MNSEDIKSDHFLYKKMQSNPEGKIKLAIGLEKLLEKKNFNSISTAEIAKVSGVNESLIYRYYKDKRGLLYYILAEHQKESLQQVYSDLATITDILGKLKKLIWRTLYNWNKDRVHAKILLIEVRNLQDYYESDTYSIVKEYCQLIKSLIKEGIKNGVIHKSVSPWFLMQIILGSIEHVVLPSLLFDREYDVDQSTETIFQMVFNSVLTKDSEIHNVDK